jgi:hypothetical protein
MTQALYAHMTNKIKKKTIAIFKIDDGEKRFKES